MNEIEKLDVALKRKRRAWGAALGRRVDGCIPAEGRTPRVGAVRVRRAGKGRS